jgi:hypothetical protein
MTLPPEDVTVAVAKVPPDGALAEMLYPDESFAVPPLYDPTPEQEGRLLTFTPGK